MYRSFTTAVPRIDISGVQTPAHDTDGAGQNVLVVGNDSRVGATPAELKALATQQDGGSISTDTMMIVHLPSDGSPATLISLPRDSVVHIPGYQANKLNAAYVDGYYGARSTVDKVREEAGAKLLIETVQNLTGLTINHYLGIGLLGFYRISTAVGGVPVNLCAAQDDPYSGINLPKGVSMISGTQALAFVRQRHGLAGGDLDRVKRQQYFMTALFHQIANVGTVLNPSKVNDIRTAVQKSLVMDTGLDLLSLAGVAANGVTEKTIPNDGSQQTASGEDGLAVSPAEVQAFIQKIVNPPKANALNSTPLEAPANHPLAPVAYYAPLAAVSSADAAAPAADSPFAAPAAASSKCIN